MLGLLMWESKTRWHSSGAPMTRFNSFCSCSDMQGLQWTRETDQISFTLLCTAESLRELGVLLLNSIFCICSLVLFLGQKMFTVLGLENENTGLGSEAVSCQDWHSAG